MDTKKLFLSAVAALATSKVAKTITSIELADVLGVVGLERRQNRALENLGLIAVGALAGAGAALLLAPATGRETRERMGRELNRLGSAASEVAGDVAAEVRAEAPNLMSRIAGETRNHHESARS